MREKIRTDSTENAKQQEFLRKVIEKQNLEIEKEREARRQEIAAQKDGAEKIAADELKSEEENKKITQYLAKSKNTQAKLRKQLSIWGKVSELYSVEQAFIKTYNAKCKEIPVSQISQVAVPSVFYHQKSEDMINNRYATSYGTDSFGDLLEFEQELVDIKRVYSLQIVCPNNKVFPAYDITAIERNVKYGPEDTTVIQRAEPKGRHKWGHK